MYTGHQPAIRPHPGGLVTPPGKSLQALPPYPYKGRPEPAQTETDRQPVIEYYPPASHRITTLPPRPGMVAPRSATLPPRYPRQGGTLTGTGQHLPRSSSGGWRQLGGSSGNLVQQAPSLLTTNGNNNSTSGSKSSLSYNNTSHGSRGYIPLQLPSDDGAPFMRPSSRNTRYNCYGSR